MRGLYVRGCCSVCTLQATKIIHKEAVQIIARKVQPWFLDKENDNYVRAQSSLSFILLCRADDNV